MVERGAPPQVSPIRKRLLKSARGLTTPLVPDDYIALMNPMWSTKELRGRIERIQPETPEASTIVIKPAFEWPGHEPGQYLRIGVEIDGRRHWRAYSLTSDPDHPEGLLSITVKHVPEGQMSPHFTRRIEPGAMVFLGGVEGTFGLPDPLPDKLLMISAGSGITPIMSMVRALDQEDELDDAVLIHSARTKDDVIFGSRLEDLDERRPGFRLHLQLTREEGRLSPPDLDRICPDWRERETFLSGPSDMLDAMSEHWDREADCERLHMERFQPKVGLVEEGEGGEISFLASEATAKADGGTPILVAGE